MLRSVRDLRTMLVVAAYLVGLRAARGRDLAAAALPGPGAGRDVAAGDRARLAPSGGRAGPGRLARRRRRDRAGWSCCRSAPASPATRHHDPVRAGALWVGVAALALASIGRPTPARHPPRPARRPGVRRLGDLGPRRRDAGGRRSSCVAALAVPSFSLVAFWLYSLGMHRAAVPSTTASMIVAQTFVPAAIGVALLGDGVRDGWWPAVAARPGARDRRRGGARRSDHHEVARRVRLRSLNDGVAIDHVDRAPRRSRWSVRARSSEALSPRRP